MFLVTSWRGSRRKPICWITSIIQHKIIVTPQFHPHSPSSLYNLHSIIIVIHIIKHHVPSVSGCKSLRWPCSCQQSTQLLHFTTSDYTVWWIRWKATRKCQACGGMALIGLRPWLWSRGKKAFAVEWWWGVCVWLNMTINSHGRLICAKMKLLFDTDIQ